MEGVAGQVSADFRALVDAVFAGKKPRTPPLVEVLWLDAEDIDGDWLTNDDIERSHPAPTLSVGYMVHRDNKCVKLVSLVNVSHAAHGLTIPAGMVRRITRLSR